MNEEKEQEKTEGENQPSFMERTYANIKEIVKFVIISLIIVVPIRMWVAQPFIVSGASMEPNFLNGDYLIVDELSLLLRNPERNEVVVLKLPNNSSFLIKRIIGLPNEKIEIKEGKIRVFNEKNNDGFILKEKFINETPITYPDAKITLKNNEYFFLGDNREKSLDSRMLGSIPKSNIIGRAFIRLWPIQSIGLLTANGYEKQ